MKSECPNPKAVKCRGCGKHRHVKKDCPERKNKFRDIMIYWQVERSWSFSIICHICKQRGHMQSECPNPKAIKCHEFREHGHAKKHCKERKVNERPNPRAIKCCKCGEHGHAKKDCKEKEDQWMSKSKDDQMPQMRKARARKKGL